MPLDLIDFDAAQPRRAIDEVKLQELADAIRAVGVLEPVSLRSDPACAGRYIVNRGERRVRASRLAGLTTVPAFLDERVDPYAQVIENLHREDLTPFDLARFVAERRAEGQTKAEIARRLGKPASFISEVAGLVDAPVEVRALYDTGRSQDTRVLYEVARGLRQRPDEMQTVLAGDRPVSRKTLEGAARASPCAGEPGTRRVEGTRQAKALLVEHAGRRGRLRLVGQPGRRTAPVLFEDGTREQVELEQLKLLAWTGG
jgi:ParB family chromosome partitioning protein